jgi:hypothetical protein
VGVGVAELDMKYVCGRQKRHQKEVVAFTVSISRKIAKNYLDFK